MPKLAHFIRAFGVQLRSIIVRVYHMIRAQIAPDDSRTINDTGVPAAPRRSSNVDHPPPQNAAVNREEAKDEPVMAGKPSPADEVEKAPESPAVGDMPDWLGSMEPGAASGGAEQPAEAEPASSEWAIPAGKVEEEEKLYPPVPAPAPAWMSEPPDLDDEFEAGDEQTEEARALTTAYFAAYYPNEAVVNERYALIVYAYTEEMKLSIERDVEKYREELGGVVPRPKTAKDAAHLEADTRITVVPECDEIKFEPESLTKTWRGDWTRFEFEFRANQDHIDETLFVRVSIQVAGVEIAHIKCAIDVISSRVEKPQPETTVSNPLAMAKLKSQIAMPYQRIFISYSRQDSVVARAYKIAQTALGNDIFLDVDNLRAGEDWRATLAKAIDDADIFQLFWSEHSSQSEHCRYEWDYAVKFRCPDNNCEGFIRPVYWRRPMPSPPDELSHINFRYVPFEGE